MIKQSGIWAFILFPLFSWAQMKSHNGRLPIEEGITQVTSAAPFAHGFAKVKQGEITYYINAHGEKVFDSLDPYAGVTLGNVDDIEAYKSSIKDTLLSTKVIRFLNTGKWGVMSPAGEILLPAEYDSLEVDNPFYWKLKKENKVSLYLKGGKKLPFYEDIGYLDGNYFDIKQQGKWGIYSLEKKRLVIQPNYDAFDYCGGCGRKSTYVYASRGGKWGIINWNERELLPFEYDHEHVGMRSDNWVQSFTKNGKQLLIHIPTKKEFPADARDNYPKIVAGLLIFKEFGQELGQSRETVPQERYGIYGADGNRVVAQTYEWIDEPNANSYLGYFGPYLLAKKDGGTGVINHKGEWIIQPRYDEIHVYDDYFVAKRNNQSILLDKHEKELLRLDNVEITHLDDYFYSSGSKGLAVFKIKQKAFYGLYFPEQGKYYQPEFYEINAEAKYKGQDNDLIVAEKQGQLTVFNLSGNLLLPARYNGYHFIDKLPDSLVQVKKGTKFGLYNTRAQREIIPLNYEDNFEVINGENPLLITQKGPYDKQSYEFWDLQGNRLFNGSFSHKDTLNASTYLLGKELEAGYMLFDSKTNQVQQLNYPYVWTVGSPHLLLVSTDQKVGKLFHIKKGQELDGMYNVSQFTFDLDDTAAPYTILYPFKNGFARIMKNGKYGFIDGEGKELMSPSYAFASDFQPNGLAVVTKDKKESRYYTDALQTVNFVDRLGKAIYPSGYLAPDLNFSDFSELFLDDNILLFKREDQTGDLRVGLGSSEGQILLDPVYNEVVPLQNKPYLFLKKAGKFGLADRKGHLMVPAHYDNIVVGNQDFQEEVNSTQVFPLLVSKDDKWFYIDEYGERLPIEAASLDNLLYY